MTGPEPRIFREGRIGAMTLKNRVIMGPMHVRLEEQEDGWRNLQAFYEERAANEVACIVTGGYSPDKAGRFDERAKVFDEVARQFKPIVEAVHAHGSRFVLQLLHTGRSGFHDQIVGPSAIRSPINGYPAVEMTDESIERTLSAFAECARRAREIGFDGVEIMGCEGYLVSQFLCAGTNQRADRWGGDWDHRTQFPLELVRRIRHAVGDQCAVLFRLSFIDLMSDGNSWDELVSLLRALEAAGVDAFHAGIGWHESRLPTVSGMVPDNAFGALHERVRTVSTIPIIAGVKIHTPEAIDEVMEKQGVDFVSLARPFLADPALVRKLANRSLGPVNVCISCNQSCLDHVFLKRPVSCLVNPRAGNESRFDESPVFFPKRVLIVGGGPAGVIAALTAAKRGHRVVLAEATGEIGGLLRIASKIPGKEKFAATILYYEHALRKERVDVRLNLRVDAHWVKANGFGDVVVATGTRPNPFRIAGDDGRFSMDYKEFFENEPSAADGASIIIGAGKIAIDVALFLKRRAWQSYAAFWGIDLNYTTRGGRTQPVRPGDGDGGSVTLLKRSATTFRKGLGPTTGWAIAEVIESCKIRVEHGVRVEAMTANTVAYAKSGVQYAIDADRIIYCTGQIADNALYDELVAADVRAWLAGSASFDKGANAQFAFQDGYRIGCSI
jgi:2,4-dienoyl-CoA reductase (NADPH2)